MPEPEAAVAILRTRAPDPAILLMRRTEREGDPWSGHWSLPGGRRDPSDVNLLHTALRELQEECGIRLSPEQVSAALPPTLARRRTGPFLLVAPFVFEIDAELPLVLDPNEAAGAMWVPLRTLLDPAQHSFRRVPGMPAEMWFPTIALPGVPLWGFTYRLLTDWLEISPRASAPGFDVARSILDFLLSQGLTLESPWSTATQQNGGDPGPLHTARLIGAIPVDTVIEHFSSPGAHVANIGRVEVWPERIHILGSAADEYRIELIIAPAN